MLTDYSHLTPSETIEIAEVAIATANHLIDTVVSETSERTYANTLAPLDQALNLVRDADGVSAFMARIHPDELVRAAGSKADETIQKWLSNIAFNRDLYETIRDYSQNAAASELDGEWGRNLDFWLRDFRRAGQELAAEDRDKLQALRNDLIELHVAYERNLDEWDDGLEVSRDDLGGMSEAYLGRLAPGAVEGTYRVTVSYPDYVPLMEQCTNRDLRQKMQFKFMNRAADANLPLLNKAVQVRWDIARLLGYERFVDLALEPKMADPESLAAFYDSLIPGLLALGQAELNVLTGLMSSEYPDQILMPWDWTFYDARQAELDFGVDNNLVSEYFPLGATVQGMLDICAEVFGIEFAPIEQTKAWDDDVLLFEIRNAGERAPIAYFYADLHPRPGKYGHAACWRLRAGCLDTDGTYRLPISAIACNFTKPTSDSPSLLQHSEVETLFHEFGHVLHNTLTETKLPRFSGTQTERDFVEAPSQIMENWTWEPTVLRRFARHHKTGEPIPEQLLASLVQARNQNIALKTLRQVFFGQYDLALHGGTAPTDAADAYWDNIGLTVVPGHPGTHFGASFGHMMSDGYAAGYYGYLWSKVYGDDMFSVFIDQGVLNPSVGRRYRNTILAQGGTKDGTELLVEFLERTPSSQAFLAKLGL
ncbi:MAG: Zn-dependent oligopeptidase [Acidimicrobiia bacterium]|nr:Zn-dependent oligopeptidase [Acidimicrobiia bacterium]